MGRERVGRGCGPPSPPALGGRPLGWPRRKPGMWKGRMTQRQGGWGIQLPATGGPAQGRRCRHPMHQTQCSSSARAQPQRRGGGGGAGGSGATLAADARRHARHARSPAACLCPPPGSAAGPSQSPHPPLRGKCVGLLHACWASRSVRHALGVDPSPSAAANEGGETVQWRLASRPPLWVEAGGTRQGGPRGGEQKTGGGLRGHGRPRLLAEHGRPPWAPANPRPLTAPSLPGWTRVGPQRKAPRAHTIGA